jgi:hypothetical protein
MSIEELHIVNLKLLGYKVCWQLYVIWVLYAKLN